MCTGSSSFAVNTGLEEGAMSFKGELESNNGEVEVDSDVATNENRAK